MDRRDFLKTAAGAVVAGAAAPVAETIAAQRREGPFAAPPIDMNVYDAAALSSLVGLTARSVSRRSRPEDVPDFTRGKWRTLPPLDLVRA